jgi:subfamily B ATP-binding cassette protein HlyB/CyaB
MISIAEQPDCSRAPAAGAALLGALAIVARHRGIHLSPAQLRRDHRIAADGPTPEELLRITRANGLRAVPARLAFDDLMQMGRALPAVLLLNNGCAMVLLRAEAKAQPPHVVVQDPLAGEDAPLTLDALWHGRAT